MLSNDTVATIMIMNNYMTFLLSGHTIKDIEIRADTMKCYILVNNYYVVNDCCRPFNDKSDSNAALLLKDQEQFEQEPARREPLPDNPLVKMCTLAAENSLGLRAAIWDINGLGRLGGCCQQYFTMDAGNVIKKYVLPSGVQDTQDFCVQKFTFQRQGHSSCASSFDIKG